MVMIVRAIESLSRLGGRVAIGLLAAAVLVVCQMIVMRYFLKASTVWQTEFVVFSLVAAMFLGAAQVLRDRGHVGVDLLPAALPARSRKMLQVVAAILSLAFLCLLGWSAWAYFHEAWTRGWTTETVWALPLWIPLLPMPVGIAMIILQYLAELMKLAAGLDADEGTGVHGIDHPQQMAD
jgi:TRAP-type C4-dicarboxylate transport system permease small subunit